MNNPSDQISGSASTSSVVDRYQEHCQGAAMPDLARFVASGPALDPRELAALVHVDQRHRHAAGVLLPAEGYFESFPALRSDIELALDVVYQEYVLKRDAGEAYSTDKYLSRFPDLAEQLAMQFDLDGAMGDEHSSRSMANPRVTVEQSPAYPPGTVIAGRYKLLEEIGEGGMGTVWVAQQTEPVRRRVALKLIKAGMDSRQVLSRFEAERQALALMDHPHIAKVLDGGMTDQGRPYFVMEYVKGEPITDYCDRARLSVKERLKLFVHVCHAVQHAHQKGIIHRDLKPSNILVCPYDGQPVPKVIDFGLAKAMHQSLSEHSLYTAHGVMVGTPMYMSPEQAETNNLDIDTRSDLYSLGVILYELLTGSTPLEKRRFQDAAWQEILRLIKEEEPPKPSTKLSGSGSLPTIAAQRSLEPAQLSRAVRGDLDWIVMKSLAKERSRRYETANGLARDIERYLHDDPVEARPPSAGYRLSKFARRNKAALLTVGLVAVALVVGTIVSTWQAIRATRAENLADARLVTETEARRVADNARAAEAEQRKAAEAERTEAEKQRAAAEVNLQKAKAAVDEYFTLVSENKLFDVPGLQPLRKELLEAALRFYESSAVERTSDPAVLADLAVTYMRVAMINHAMGQNDDAFTAADHALDVVDRLRRDYPRATEHHRRLAGFWKGLRRVEQTNRLGPVTISEQAAIDTFQRLVTTWEQLAAENPAEVGFQGDLAAMYILFGELLDFDRPSMAANFLEKGRSILEKLVGEYPNVSEYRADLARVYELLFGNLHRSGRPTEAESAFRRSLALYEQLVADFPNVPQYRVDLAMILQQLADRLSYVQEGDAIASYRRAIDLVKGLLTEFPVVPKYHNLMIDIADDVLRLFPLSHAQHQEAQALHRELLPLLTQLTAESREPPVRIWHRETVSNFFELARHLDKAGQRQEAEKAYRQGLRILERFVTKSPNDRDARQSLAQSYQMLASALVDAGRNEEAKEAFHSAADVFARLNSDFPSEPWYLESVGHNLRLFAFIDRTPQQEMAFRDAAEIFQQLASDYPGVASHRHYLADTYHHLGILLAAGNRVEEAEKAYRQALDVHEKRLAEFPDDRDARQSLAAYCRTFGTAMTDAGRHDDARTAFQRAADLFAKLSADFPSEPSYRRDLGHSLRPFAMIEADADQNPEREKAYREAVEIFRRLAADFPNVPSHRHYCADTYRLLGGLLARAHRLQEAETAYRQALEIQEKRLAEFPGQTISVGEEAAVYSELGDLLSGTGRPSEAKTLYQKLLDLQPKNARAHNNLAWLFATSPDASFRDPARSVELAKKAVELDSTRPNWNTLGAAQCRAGDWNAAIAALQKSMELGQGGDAFDWFFLSMANCQLDQKEEARRWYDKATEWMEKNQPKNEELLRFRTEAEKLLGITQPSPAPNDALQGDDTAKPKS